MPVNHDQKDTIIIGGGQAGLAMSYLLTEQGREHLILEKKERIGESWRGRWDSFTLVTPNWQLQLPGHPYHGEDPDGFLKRDEVVRYLEEYVELFNPPLRFGVEVTAVKDNPHGDGYLVRTMDGDFRAENVVVAVGTFQRPDIPAFSADLPEDIHQLHSSSYQRPEKLPEGPVLVVGSGQSGCQIAQELHESGREIYLCTGSATRLPRRYRGKDSMWWADKLGIMSQTLEDLEDPSERFNPNPQISGKDGGQDINLHRFARKGIRLLGHLEGVQGTTVDLAPDLHENLARADRFAAEFYKGVDMFVEKAGLDVPVEKVPKLKDGYEQKEITELDLVDAEIQTVLWATGFDWDYSWVKPAFLDKFGYPVQKRGVTDSPGLYFLGLHFLYNRSSGLFFGVGDDAEHIAAHMKAHRR